jgi:hypothetical protein
LMALSSEPNNALRQAITTEICRSGARLSFFKKNSGAGLDSDYAPQRRGDRRGRK